MTENKPAVPPADRPFIPGYGIPESLEGTLPWAWVSEQMVGARNYWISTVDPQGHPHAVPVWGVWLDEILCFGGGPDTRKARNIAVNPYVVVHPETGDNVVIIEGIATEVTDPALQERIDDAYEVKYGMRHGSPTWQIRPRTVYAWDRYPDSATRWRFSDERP